MTNTICKDEDLIRYCCVVCVHGTLGNPLGQVNRLDEKIAERMMNENQIFESR